MTNSRFAAAAEADRSYNRDDRGPPPMANSRFAAAAEADRSYNRDDRGPPLMASSRFAAAAEADRSYNRDDRGPPPMANSRFAAAAAMAEQDDGPRNSYRDRDSRPLQQNSRFAAAAAADEDYVDREERERRMADRQMEDRFGGRDDDGRGFGGRDDGGGRYGGRDDGGRGYGGRDEYRGGGGFRGGNNDGFDSRPPQKSKVDNLLKPKAPPAVDNILKVPVKATAEQEANMLQMPVKSKKSEEEEAPATKVVEPAAPEPVAVAPAVDVEEMLDEFASGNKLGDDLKAWCEERRTTLPPVEKLVFHMLQEREKLNPDVECGWADASKYGAALTALIGDDIYQQMQVLWGVQFYCDKLGFPKLNDEYVVQAMFRSMYKFDLAGDEAFAEWKEDESDEHVEGKMKAIIQTVDWFNWLEEDDEEEEEEYDEDYEE